MSDDMKFLNPYTFVPAFPRDGLPEPLGDGSPLGVDPGKAGHGSGRDRLHSERWTGRIGVRLTVETPLLLLDTARGTAPSEGADTHRVYPVQVRGGRPHLAATSLKGMLRSAYETITNSRFGVFDGHDTRLGFRHSTDYALAMKPVRIAENGVLHVYKSALLKRYDKSGNITYSDWEGRENGEVPRHLDEVIAGVEGTKVIRITRKDYKENSLPEVEKWPVEGVVYATGPNIEGKRFERLFYLKRKSKKQQAPLARSWHELEDAWAALISDYQVEYSKKGENDRDHGNRYLWDPEYTKLKVGTFCWAHYQDGKVDGLYPVMVPRDLYPVPPSDLLDRSLLPAAHIGELSPADRVFGWVAPGGKGVRPSAYRGRLRIGPVSCEQDTDEAVERFGGDGLPLAILGQPKPQQGRFYLAQSMKDPDRPIKDGTPREKLYQPGQGLRGRKVYWHHAGLNRRDHWSEGQKLKDPTQVRIDGHYREYRRPYAPDGGEGSQTAGGKRHQEDTEQRDTQNRSIEGWVRPRTTFRFVIEVRDLDDYELGALAWLLDLPPGHFHRLGLGRPLGFGSVRLDVDRKNTELHTGAEYAAHYRDLSGTLPGFNGLKRLTRARETFNQMVEGVDSLKKIRDAMLAVSRGNSELPVHYPRTQQNGWQGKAPAPPDPEGGNYAWFTENEKKQSSEIIQERRRSLPDPLKVGKQLVIYPEEKKKGTATSPKEENQNGRVDSRSDRRGKGWKNGGRSGR